MYSTFATLDQIEDDGCKRVSIAPRTAAFLYMMKDMETLHALCMSSVMAQKSLKKWVRKLVQNAISLDDPSTYPETKETEKQAGQKGQVRLQELQKMARRLSVNNEELNRIVRQGASLATAMESLSLGESRQQTPQPPRPATRSRHHAGAKSSGHKPSSSFSHTASTPATPTRRLGHAVSSSNPRERSNSGAAAQRASLNLPPAAPSPSGQRIKAKPSNLDTIPSTPITLLHSSRRPPVRDLVKASNPPERGRTRPPGDTSIHSLEDASPMHVASTDTSQNLEIDEPPPPPGVFEDQSQSFSEDRSPSFEGGKPPRITTETEDESQNEAEEPSRIEYADDSQSFELDVPSHADDEDDIYDP